MKPSLDKCQFCQPRVEYVGLNVSSDGVATDPDKIQAPQPTDFKLLRSFFGFCGYCQRFIANYSFIVGPLTELTKGYVHTQRRGKWGLDRNKTYLNLYSFPSQLHPSSLEQFSKADLIKLRERMTCLSR